jgi:hypothetical protein
MFATRQGPMGSGRSVSYPTCSLWHKVELIFP